MHLHCSLPGHALLRARPEGVWPPGTMSGERCEEPRNSCGQLCGQLVAGPGANPPDGHGQSLRVPSSKPWLVVHLGVAHMGGGRIECGHIVDARLGGEAEDQRHDHIVRRHLVHVVGL